MQGSRIAARYPAHIQNMSARTTNKVCARNLTERVDYLRVSLVGGCVDPLDAVLGLLLLMGDTPPINAAAVRLVFRLRCCLAGVTPGLGLLSAPMYSCKQRALTCLSADVFCSVL